MIQSMKPHCLVKCKPYWDRHCNWGRSTWILSPLPPDLILIQCLEVEYLISQFALQLVVAVWHISAQLNVNMYLPEESSGKKICFLNERGTDTAAVSFCPLPYPLLPTWILCDVWRCSNHLSIMKQLSQSPVPERWRRKKGRTWAPYARFELLD